MHERLEQDGFWCMTFEWKKDIRSHLLDNWLLLFGEVNKKHLWARWCYFSSCGIHSHFCCIVYRKWWHIDILASAVLQNIECTIAICINCWLIHYAVSSKRHHSRTHSLDLTNYCSSHALHTQSQASRWAHAFKITHIGITHIALTLPYSCPT